MQHTAQPLYILYSRGSYYIYYIICVLYIYIKPRASCVMTRGTLFVRNFAHGIIIVDANYAPMLMNLRQA